MAPGGYYLGSICGRYGKRHGENFARKVDTDEPMRTPRVHFYSDEEWEQGNTLSDAAWEEWRRRNFGPEEEVQKSHFFDVIDQDLLEISRLIWSSVKRDNKLGLTKLYDRLKVAQDAEESLKDLIEDGDEQDKFDLEEKAAKGPKVLRNVYKLLNQGNIEDARRQLSNWCPALSPADDQAEPQSGSSIMATGLSAAASRNQSSQYSCFGHASNNSNMQPSGTASGASSRNPSVTNLAEVFQRTNTCIQPPSTRAKQLSNTAQTSGLTPLLSSHPTYHTRINNDSGASFPSNITVRDFAQPPNHQPARPASPTPRTVLYMTGGGTRPPTYIPSPQFQDIDNERGIERPPAYQTRAPTKPLPANFVPRRAAGEDRQDMAMEERREVGIGRDGPRRTMVPDTVRRVRNGVDGRGEGRQRAWRFWRLWRRRERVSE